MTLLKDKAIQAMLLGDWECAASLNKELIEEDPKDIDAMNRLAYAYTIQGKIKNAKTVYGKVLKIDPLNQIATRNIKKLTEMKPKEIAKSYSLIKGVNNIFLEETGKTKIISLVNIAQPKITSLLSTGQPVVVMIKRSKIFIEDQCDQYLGVLPDDVGRRLIKLIRGGNAYEACVKSANEHNVCVFIKEIKRTPRYKNQPSFLQTDGHGIGFSKKEKVKSYNKETKDEEEDRSYFLDEES